jgi:ankyrin repeat and BTB/POZ domain-containing protein 1
MDENGEINAESITDEAVDTSDPTLDPFMSGEIKTLDGEIAGDEFAADAINYQILLGKIDALLERLKLDA